MQTRRGRRKNSLRLRGYDYSQGGGYFITVCTDGREHLFGEIHDVKMIENQNGQIVGACWNDLPNHYPNVELDEFVVMPNHVHGIIFIIENDVGARHASPLQAKRYDLGDIVGSWKSAVTKQINELRGTQGASIWQRSFHDHIIRDEKSLNRIREYIITNPERWEYDQENMNRVGQDEFDKWLSSLKKHPVIKRKKP
jgi:REP element-mobilizing transposase RayT